MVCALPLVRHHNPLKYWTQYWNSLYLFLIYNVIIRSFVILDGFIWYWHLVYLSYSFMSYIDSKVSLRKWDFKSVGMAVHPSFLLAFNSLLLIDIYVYLTVDSCIIFSSFEFTFGKQINFLEKNKDHSNNASISNEKKKTVMLQI